MNALSESNEPLREGNVTQPPSMRLSFPIDSTQKYHRAIAKQGLHWNIGHTMISQLMAARKFFLGIVYEHRFESMKKIWSSNRVGQECGSGFCDSFAGCRSSQSPSS
jgi:hypothetical protein